MDVSQDSLPIIKYPQIFYCGGERIPSAATNEGQTQASFLFVATSLLVWSTRNWHQKVVALMEAAAKETEAAHIPGDVWVWLPDRMQVLAVKEGMRGGGLTVEALRRLQAQLEGLVGGKCAMVADMAACMENEGVQASTTGKGGLVKVVPGSGSRGQHPTAEVEGN